MTKESGANSSPCAILFVLFLCAACNENLTQNTDSKNQNLSSPGAAQSQISHKDPNDLNSSPGINPIPTIENDEPFFVKDLAKTDSPTLLYGSSPRFLRLASDADHWKADLRPENADDYVPNYYSIDDHGLTLAKNNANDYGLYFGSYPLKAKITVCNDNSCKITPISRQEFVAIHSDVDQFDQLYDDAQDLNPSSGHISEWNLYFFKNDMSGFEDTKNATLTITQGNDASSIILDWNGLAGKTGSTTLMNSSSDAPTFKTIQFDNKFVLIGKYKSATKEYKLIGIEQQSIVN